MKEHVEQIWTESIRHVNRLNLMLGRCAQDQRLSRQLLCQKSPQGLLSFRIDFPGQLKFRSGICPLHENELASICVLAHHIQKHLSFQDLPPGLRGYGYLRGFSTVAGCAARDDVSQTLSVDFQLGSCFHAVGPAQRRRRSGPVGGPGCEAATGETGGGRLEQTVVRKQAGPFCPRPTFVFWRPSVDHFEQPVFQCLLCVLLPDVRVVQHGLRPTALK